MKSPVMIGVLAVTAIIVSMALAFSLTNTDFQSSESNMQRTYGAVDTTMGSPLKGSPDAPITIVDFGDYQCPQCYRWFHTIKPQVEEHYVHTGKANMYFVDLAFFGPDSVNAARASYCAGDQGQYWNYHDMLYEKQGGINDGWASVANLKGFASELGLDRGLFDICLDSGKYQKRVAHNVEEAKKNGIGGTPSFIIVGPDGTQQMIEGAQPFAIFKQVLDSML